MGAAVLKAETSTDGSGCTIIVRVPPLTTSAAIAG